MCNIEDPYDPALQDLFDPDQFDISQAFLTEIAAHRVAPSEASEVLNDESVKWVGNRGDASLGLCGHTSAGRCLYIPADVLDNGRLRPVTAYDNQQP